MSSQLTSSYGPMDVLKELTTTEIKCGDVLGIIMTKFALPAKSILLKEDYDEFFNDIGNMYAIHLQFRPTCETFTSESTVLAKLSELIPIYRQIFPIYFKNLMNKHERFQTLQEKYPKFLALCQENHKDLFQLTGYRNLADAMYVACGRLPRYKLLLQDYLKKLDSHSIHFEKVKEMLSEIAYEQESETICK